MLYSMKDEMGKLGVKHLGESGVQSGDLVKQMQAGVEEACELLLQC
jgi:hypothetical protein